VAALRYIGQPHELVGGNTVRLLRNGEQAFPAWLDAIDNARERVSMEMYIFNDDKAGRRFADALSCAARRGVTVRLLYDFIGCRHASPAFFWNLRRAGVFTIAYHPYRFWRPRFWTLLRRNHRKTLVCDGQVAFTGGVNIAEEWLSESDGGGGWHDAAVEVRGPAVALLEAAFLKAWNRRARRRARLKPSRLHPPALAGQVPVEVIANTELLDRFAIRRSALQAIRASEERVFLVSPYLVPDPGFIYGLAAAVARGVDVRVLVPAHSDSRLLDLAAQAGFSRLLRAGVRIFRREPMVHTKALLVDRDFVSVGTYNFDHRSLAYNLELVVNALDREYNAAVAAMFEDEMGASEEVLWSSFSMRSLFTRLLERLAYSLRHWL
jgi:cardiolipin synthase